MATSDRRTDATRGESDAELLQTSAFVTVSVAPTGDALAATGVLVRSLQSCGIPFHVRVGPSPSVAFPEPLTTIGVGDEFNASSPDMQLEPSAIEHVCDLAIAMGTEPDSVLAAVGRAAWGTDSDETEDDTSLDRSPGIGLPTPDVADGLAHTTLFRGPWSGDTTASEVPTQDNDRTLASLVTLEALAASVVPARTASAIERAANPQTISEGPFTTIEGYADVLDVLSAVDPGAALALVCADQADVDDALDVWRTAAAAVHQRLDDGPSERYDDLAAYRDADPAPQTLARLARDFEVEEPNVLAVSDRSFAVATGDAEGIDRLDDAETIETRYRHGTRRLSGEHTGEAAKLEAEIAEVLR